MKELQDGALGLLKAAWKPPTPIRMLSVTALHLSMDAAEEQIDLFQTDAAARERQEVLEGAMAKIRAKYGNASISYATNLPEQHSRTTHDATDCAAAAGVS